MILGICNYKAYIFKDKMLVVISTFILTLYSQHAICLHKHIEF